MTQTPVQRFLTTDEVAELLRTSPSTVRFWRHTRPQRGPASFRAGRRVLYDAAVVDAWIAQRQASAPGGRVGAA